MRYPLLFAISSLSFAGLWGCGEASNSASKLHLTNAIVAAEGEFPAVVLIAKQTGEHVRYCTASFINDHQVLTAAHCLGQDGSAQQLYLLQPVVTGEGSTAWAPRASALRARVHPEYRYESDRISSYDIAVLDFPAGTSSAFVRIATRQPAVNATVTLVGFGHPESTGHGGLHSDTIPSAKRYGSNTIRSKQTGLLSIAGVSVSEGRFPAGAFVSSTPGDSGSPWIVEGRIVSLTVGAERKDRPQGQALTSTYAVDLASPAIQDFLNQETSAD